MSIAEQADAEAWHPDVPVERARVAWAAAEGYIASRCSWPAYDTDGRALPAPAALVQAVRLLTARYLARHNSPDGLAAAGGELGPVRVAGTDRDVEALIGPYRRVVIG